jgi:peroxiredoxin
MVARHWLAWIAILLAACGTSACEPRNEPGNGPGTADAAPLGQYRAVLSVAGGDLPFGLELTRENGLLVAWLSNGPERVRVPDVHLDGDHLTMRMPGYPHRLDARFKDARFEGTLELLRPRGVIKSVRIIAMPGQDWRFFPKPDLEPQDFSGRWALTFVDASGHEEAAIAELTQRGHEVTGTVLRASGDDRFIAGEARGNTLFLSRFDGGSAYLYLGRLGPNGTLSGDFYSGGGAHETWSGRRDPGVRLEDPAQMTALQPGMKSLAFTFPNLDGSPVSFPGRQFDGKVVLITIGGSWCPNCHDEAVFLRNLLAGRRSQGLEVIQLMFEYTPDFASASASARAFADKFAIDYPVLIAGTTSDGDVLKKLPQLKAFRAYPTLFIIDRKGMIRRTHAGFAGPATGVHYDEQNGELTAFVDTLLKERG